MLKTTLAFILSVFLTTAAYAKTKQVVDCNKVSSTSSAAIYRMFQLGDTEQAKIKVFAALPATSKHVGLSESELIVATGIVANVSVVGAKQFYSDLELTKATKNRKLQATRNVFYMFCEDAFIVKSYY